MSSSFSLETALKRFDHLLQIWGLSTKKELFFFVIIKSAPVLGGTGQTTHSQIASILWLQLHSNVGYFQLRCPKWLVTASRPWCHRIQSKLLMDRSGHTKRLIPRIYELRREVFACRIVAQSRLSGSLRPDLYMAWKSVLNTLFSLSSTTS